MSIKLTRQALYDRVWETPLKYLAQEFGLDPVRLSKCCVAYAIPKPGYGYWTLREMAKPVVKTPLGPPPAGLGDLIDIPQGYIKLSRMAGKKSKGAQGPAEPEVAKVPEPTSIHRLAQKTLEKLAKGKAGELLQVKGRGLFTVTATPGQAERVAMVLSCLVTAVEAQGWRVPSGEGGLRLEPDGEVLDFSITEQTDKVKHEPSEAEQAALRRHEEAKQRAVRMGKWFSDWDRPKIPEWDWIPNGHLVLALGISAYRQDSVRRTFRDGKTQRLEGLVDRIIDSLAAYAVSEKDGRVRRERDRLEAAEREKRRQEAQRQQELDNKRYEFLQAQAKRLDRALEVERVIETIAAQGEAEGAVAAFIDWGRQLARDIRANLSFDVLTKKLERHGLMNDDAQIGSWVDVDKLGY